MRMFLPFALFTGYTYNDGCHHYILGMLDYRLTCVLQSIFRIVPERCLCLCSIIMSFFCCIFIKNFQ